MEEYVGKLTREQTLELCKLCYDNLDIDGQEEMDRYAKGEEED